MTILVGDPIGNSPLGSYAIAATFTIVSGTATGTASGVATVIGLSQSTHVGPIGPTGTTSGRPVPIQFRRIIVPSR